MKISKGDKDQIWSHIIRGFTLGAKKRENKRRRRGRRGKRRAKGMEVFFFFFLYGKVWNLILFDVSIELCLFGYWESNGKGEEMRL